MWKKLLIPFFALVLGAAVAEAKDLVTLEIYFKGEGTVSLVGKLPAGMFRAEAKKGDWGIMYPFYIDLGKAQSFELKFKINGEGKFSPALFAFRREEGKKNQAIPVTCKVFELDGEPASSVPCTIGKWKRMMTKEVEKGDEIVIKAEFEKPEE